LRNAVIPSCLAAALEPSYGVSAAGIRLYLDQMLQEADGARDPIERILIEQVAMAHHRIAQLHAQASTAKVPESSLQYTAFAARLLSELRQTVTVLQAYRPSIRPAGIRGRAESSDASGVAEADPGKTKANGPSMEEN